jgi:hypothetical protein
VRFVLIRLPLCTQVPGGCRRGGGSRRKPGRSYGIPFIVLFNVLAVFTEIVVCVISLLFLDTPSNRFFSPVTLYSGNTRYAKIWYQLETINLEPSVKNLKAVRRSRDCASDNSWGGAKERAAPG